MENGGWFLSPVMVQLGPLQIHWYGFMYALAFLIGYAHLRYSKQGKDLSLDNDKREVFFLTIIAGILLGGRLGYVLFYNLGFYVSNPLSIFAVWQGGMSFHGGLLGVLLGVIWFSRKNKVAFFKLTDWITTIAPVGILLGRVGNFINGELFGRVSESGQMCFYFPADPYSCRYPSQLFEAAFEGLFLFLILFTLGKKYHSKPGVVTSLFFILYGTFRFVIEFFREADAHIGYFWGIFTEGQILCLLMIVAGVFLLYKSFKGKR